MKKKKMVMILVILLVVGFASVSTTLIITGVVGVSSKQSDFNVIFTNAKLDGVERKDFIDKDDKQLLKFETNVLTTLEQTTTLDYEVTNTSRNYDAEVTITCNIVNEAEEVITSEYVAMDYIPKSMTVVAGENETGRITATLKKTSTTEQDINVKCTLDAKPLERTSLGAEYKETTGTYELVVDKGTEGVVDIGDEIAIGEEHFYVISKSEGKINALAKYNLNVGDNKNPNAEPGIQHETVRGYVSSGTKYGNVKFSNSNGWAYENNDTIKIKEYEGPVKEALYGSNGYESYIQGILQDSTATVRLIRKSEIEALLGETFSGYTNIKEKADAKEYPWIYYTSYWTESAVSVRGNIVWFVNSDGYFNSRGYDGDGNYGVRPVITIPLF